MALGMVIVKLAAVLATCPQQDKRAELRWWSRRRWSRKRWCRWDRINAHRCRGQSQPL
jgi:hypothetical protein